MDEAVGAGRGDRLFVEALGIELAPLQAGDLRADQGGTVGKILRAVLGPCLKLAVMRGQGLEVPGPLRIGCRIAERRPRQRGVEMIFRPLEEGGRRPEEAFSLRRRRDRGRVVAARTRACSLRIQYQQAASARRGSAARCCSNRSSSNPASSKRAEDRGQPAQRPDQLELPGDPVDDETEPRLAREVEPGLGVPLHLVERIAAGEQMRDQMGAGKGPDR